eukprot:gene12542-biopygen13331
MNVWRHKAGFRFSFFGRQVGFLLPDSWGRQNRAWWQLRKSEVEAAATPLQRVEARLRRHQDRRRSCVATGQCSPSLRVGGGISDVSGLLLHSLLDVQSLGREAAMILATGTATSGVVGVHPDSPAAGRLDARRGWRGEFPTERSTSPVEALLEITTELFEEQEVIMEQETPRAPQAAEPGQPPDAAHPLEPVQEVQPAEPAHPTHAEKATMAAQANQPNPAPPKVAVARWPVVFGYLLCKDMCLISPARDCRVSDGPPAATAGASGSG